MQVVSLHHFTSRALSRGGVRWSHYIQTTKQSNVLSGVLSSVTESDGDYFKILARLSIQKWCIPKKKNASVMNRHDIVMNNDLKKRLSSAAIKKQHSMLYTLQSRGLFSSKHTHENNNRSDLLETAMARMLKINTCQL